MLTLNKLKETSVNYPCKAVNIFDFQSSSKCYLFLANLHCRATENLLHSFPRFNVP